MNTAHIAAALATQLNTLGYPIEAENAKFTPVAGTLYLREQLLGDFSPTRPVAGGVRNISQGLYQVTVMAPKDGTRTPARNAVSDIESAFAVARQFSKSGVTVTVLDVTIAAGFTIGDRFAIPVTIAWSANG